MARDFTVAASQYLTLASNLGITAYPLTMACWFVPRNVTATTATLMSLGTSGAATHRHTLHIFATDETIFYGANDGLTNSVFSTAAATVGAWNHACAVGISATDRWVYLNGGNSAQTTTSRTPVGMNNIQVGALQGAAVSLFADGPIAHVAIWNVALSATDVAALGKGLNPTRMHPESLVGYWRMDGDENGLSDIVEPPTLKGLPLRAVNGTRFIEGPPLIQQPHYHLRRDRRLVKAAAAPAGGGYRSLLTLVVGA